MTSCPDCMESIPEGARRCRACGRWIRDAKPCPQCGETVLEAARVCRFCAYDFVEDPLTRPKIAAEVSDALPHRLIATPLGAMILENSITALFRPPELHITEEEIWITKWTFLTLRVSRQKVSLSRVASVRQNRGIFWSSLVVETFGGSIADLEITGLDKGEAEETNALLERITKAHRSKKAPGQEG